MKDEQTIKQTQKKKTSWKPFLQELGMYALRGFVTGVSMKLGGVAVDRMSRPKQTSLTVMTGGKSVANG